MTRVNDNRRTTVARRIAAITCFAVLGVAASACGSTTTPGTNNNSPGTTTPTKATGGTNAPTTTKAPKSGGAGF